MDGTTPVGPAVAAADNATVTTKSRDGAERFVLYPKMDGSHNVAAPQERL
jgi:hypothetical protein